MSQYRLRLADESDIAELQVLIPRSARELQTIDYSTAQIEAALGSIFAVDRQLIHDRTYFVAELDGAITGCGGWSKRESMYGPDGGVGQMDRLLDPKSEPARVRAFFVDPDHARRGIGRMIMKACERDIVQTGFHRVEIMATLAGERLYRNFGYAVVERIEIPMRDGLVLPVCRMAKAIEGGA